MNYNDEKAKSDGESLLNEGSTGKTVAFTFGRFQPPTSGHQKLAEALAKVASSEGATAFMYPSRTNDLKRNPLPIKSKIKWMRKFFGDSVKVVDDGGVSTMFDALSKFHQEGVKKVIMVIGGDRVAEMKKTIEPYTKGKNKKYSFEFSVASAGERDPDAEGVVGMSASKMREAAGKNDLDSFRNGMPTTASKTDAREMFDELRSAMGLKKGQIVEGRELPQGVADMSYIGSLLQTTNSVDIWLDEVDRIFYATETTLEGEALPNVHGSLETMLSMFPMAWTMLKPYLKEFAIGGRPARTRNRIKRASASHDELGDTSALRVGTGTTVYGWRQPPSFLDPPGQQKMARFTLPDVMVWQQGYSDALGGGALDPNPEILESVTPLIKPWMQEVTRRSITEGPANIIKKMRYMTLTPCSNRELAANYFADNALITGVMKLMTNILNSKNEFEDPELDSNHKLQQNKLFREMYALMAAAQRSKKITDWKKAQLFGCKNFDTLGTSLPYETVGLLFSGPDSNLKK